MRVLTLATLAALAFTGPALADPIAEVQVNLSPELQEKAVKEYGVKDLDRLKAELRRDVERSLARTGVLAGARLELTLVDARPNRPTIKQLSNRPGLSYESFSIGGAAIEGRAVSVDGTVTPISYSWYENDLRQSRIGGTWADAEYAIDRFAYQLARGKAYAGR